MDDKKNTKNKKEIENNSEPVLKKHVALIHCENRLTFLQRKISNILLFNALGTIENNDIHQMPLKQLCSLIGYRSNDIDLIKQSIKGLISTVMEWNLLDDSKFLSDSSFSEAAIAWNASSYLAGASIQKGLVNYSYSPQIKSVLFSLDIYGRINLFVQSKFSSGYSLILYENCVRFKNINKTAWFPLDLFRSLMGLKNGKYESFKELKRNVITVAINEINQKADIQIEVEYKKAGRNIVAIRFLISDNESYKPAFKRLAKIPQLDIRNESLLSCLHDILEFEFNIQRHKVQQILSQYPADYINEKITLVRETKNIGNIAAFFIAALKQDYKKIKTEPVQHKITDMTCLRETGDASEVRSLKKKYIDYKFKIYKEHLVKQAIFDKIQQEFITSLLRKNPIMGKLYERKGLQSQPAILEFIEYVDDCHLSNDLNILSFEEYLTAEVT